jgi:hypothetical protein
MLVLGLDATNPEVRGKSRRPSLTAVILAGMALTPRKRLVPLPA